MVRTSPNELSFSSVTSWKDIYGNRQGHKPFIKSAWYDGGSFADQAHSIVSERDPVVHGKMRKYLSHAFSDRALKEQEDLVDEVVDEFVTQLGKHATGKDGVDLVTWFNLATFDIIGSLAFGEEFGGVKSGRIVMFSLPKSSLDLLRYTAKVHFWIKLVTNALRQSALADTMHRFPTFGSVVRTVAPGWLQKLSRDTKIHEGHTLALIDRRLQNPSARPDFLTRILEDRDIKQISNVQLAAHASDFVYL